MTRSPARRRRLGGSADNAHDGLDSPPNVAVTGAAGPLGDHIVRALATEASVGGVVAIDSNATSARRKPGQRSDPPAGGHASIAWRTVDVRDASLAHAFDDVDVVVHASVSQDPDAPAEARRAANIEGVRTVLAAAARADVRRVVLISSAMVYGALPDNPDLLTEEHPLRAAADDSIVADFVRIEELAAEFASAHDEVEVVVLRPVTIVGPDCDGVLTRHFETSRILAIRGVVARWQFVHVADVATACALAAIGAVRGNVNVAPSDTLSQAELEEVTGSRRIELPASVVFGAADRLHRAGVTLAPSGEIAYLAYPWAVDSSRLYDAGWRPAHDSAAALAAHLTLVRSTSGARRIGRDDATRAAAGATVALLGTAALVRRSRRRRP